VHKMAAVSRWLYNQTHKLRSNAPSKYIASTNKIFNPSSPAKHPPHQEMHRESCTTRRATENCEAHLTETRVDATEHETICPTIWFQTPRENLLGMPALADALSGGVLPNQSMPPGASARLLALPSRCHEPTVPHLVRRTLELM